MHRVYNMGRFGGIDCRIIGGHQAIMGRGGRLWVGLARLWWARPIIEPITPIIPRQCGISRVFGGPLGSECTHTLRHGHTRKSCYVAGGCFSCCQLLKHTHTHTHTHTHAPCDIATRGFEISRVFGGPPGSECTPSMRLRHTRKSCYVAGGCVL